MRIKKKEMKENLELFLPVAFIAVSQHNELIDWIIKNIPNLNTKQINQLKEIQIQQKREDDNGGKQKRITDF